MGAVAAGILATIVVLVLGGHEYVISGDTDPGRFTSIAVSLLRVVATCSAALCVGALVFAAFCTVPRKSGRVDVDGYGALLLAGRAAIVWTGTAVLLVAGTAADAAGRSLGVLLQPAALPALINAQEPPKAWLTAAVLAGAVTLGIRLVLSWTGVLAVTVLAAAALLPPALAGNAAQGTGHDIGTNAITLHIVAASVYLGTLFALLAHLRRGGAHTAVAVRRYTVIAAVCWATIAVSGLTLGVILVPPDQVFTTSYGVLLVASTLLLGALGGTGCLVRQRMRRSASRPGGGARPILAYAGLDLVLLLVAMGAAVSMARQPAPAFYTRPPNVTEVFLGYNLPHPPDLSRLLTLWRPDLLLGGAAVALAVGYLVGVRRLHRQDGGWPRWRSAAWLIGCLLLLILTCSGINTYAHAMFSAHMVQHMGLNMLVPPLLVLGAPITLAVRALPPAAPQTPPGPREWVRTLAHSGAVRFLTHPVVAVVLYAATLFGLYFTGLYEQIVLYHWAHQLASIEFLVTGYTFFWAVLGVDEGPRRLPHLGRLGMLVAIMPINAIFGVAVTTTNNVIGNTFYHYLALPWMHSLISDQHTGGLIGWLGTEIPMILAAIILLARWAQSDQHTTTGADPAATDESDPYQQLLDQLAQSRR